MTSPAGFHLVSWLILTRSDEAILLARRSDVSYGAGLWGLPGGHVEDGELLVAAAARETEEEIGVVVAPGDIGAVGVSRWAERGETGLSIFFETRTWAGEPRAVSECSEIGWFALARLPTDTLDWLPGRLRAMRQGRWFDDTFY